MHKKKKKYEFFNRYVLCIYVRHTIYMKNENRKKISQLLFIFSFVLSLLQTASEKRGRLEDTLARLMTTMIRVHNTKALPAIDLSYLLTGRGARSRRQNASTPVPASS